MQFVNDLGETYDLVFPPTVQTSSTHQTEQLIVDNQNNDGGHVIIDGDQTNKLIHIQQNVPDNDSYINCEDHNGNTLFQVLGNGGLTSLTTWALETQNIEQANSIATNTISIATNTTGLAEDATAITANYNNIGNNTTTIVANTATIGNHSNTLYINGTILDDLLLWQNTRTHEATPDTTVHRDQTGDIAAAKITCSDFEWTGHITTKQIGNVTGINIKTPLEVDEEIITTESVSALADGQILWVPYVDAANNTMVPEPNAIFRLGRSENLGDSTGADDGLLFSREKDVGASAKQHVIAISPYNEGANLRISSTKVGADAPYFVCTDSDGIEMFKITKTGQIQSNGVLNNDHTTLPDANHADAALGNSSLYIGQGKVSFDGTKFVFRRLKDQTVPTTLLAAPYSLTAANLPASGNHSVQKWMDLARVAHLGAGNTHLKIKEAFPLAQEANDFDTLFQLDETTPTKTYVDTLCGVQDSVQVFNVYTSDLDTLELYANWIDIGAYTRGRINIIVNNGATIVHAAAWFKMILRTSVMDANNANHLLYHDTVTVPLSEIGPSTIIEGAPGVPRLIEQDRSMYPEVDANGASTGKMLLFKRMHYSGVDFVGDGSKILFSLFFKFSK